MEIRMFDTQWVNVVNHDNCYEGYTKEEAVAEAVRRTEVAMAKNCADNKWPSGARHNARLSGAGTASA